MHGHVSSVFLIILGVRYSVLFDELSELLSGTASIVQAGLKWVLGVRATVEDRDIAPSFVRQLLQRSKVTWSAPLHGGLAPMSRSGLNSESSKRLSSDGQYGDTPPQSSPKKFSSYKPLEVSGIDWSNVFTSERRVLGRVLFPFSAPE